jgi:hypothetical protein
MWISQIPIYTIKLLPFLGHLTLQSRSRMSDPDGWGNEVEKVLCPCGVAVVHRRMLCTGSGPVGPHSSHKRGSSGLIPAVTSPTPWRHMTFGAIYHLNPQDPHCKRDITLHKKTTCSTRPHGGRRQKRAQPLRSTREEQKKIGDQVLSGRIINFHAFRKLSIITGKHAVWSPGMKICLTNIDWVLF